MTEQQSLSQPQSIIIPRDILCSVFSFLILDHVPFHAHETTPVCVAHVCREWAEVFSRMPLANLSYDSITTESDKRFKARLTEGQLRKYSGIRRAIKRIHFRTRWYLATNRRVEKEKKEKEKKKKKNAPPVEKEKSAPFIVSSHREKSDNSETAEEYERAFVEFRNQEHLEKAALGRKMFLSNSAARAYWTSHRQVLETHYGAMFSLVFQWKKLVCQRMSLGYHGDDAVPIVAFRRAQWEACPAASLRTCVFRALADHFTTYDPSQLALLHAAVESTIVQHHQQRVKDHKMLASLIESCHTFFLKEWTNKAYKKLQDTSTVVNRIRGVCDRVQTSMSLLTNHSLTRFESRGFYNFFQLAAECTSSGWDRTRFSVSFPDRVCKRYKDDLELRYLSRSVRESTHLLRVTSLRIKSLEAQANVAVMTAIDRLCPRASIFTQASDGSLVVRVTMIHALLNSGDKDHTDSLLSTEQRIGLGKRVRRYVADNGIRNADQKVNITTQNSDKVVSTFSTYAYREEHIPILIQACLAFSFEPPSR